MTPENRAEFLKWTDSGGNEKALEAEFVIPAWKGTWSGELSEYPIEDGSELADHFIQHSDKLAVQVCVTNQPKDDSQVYKSAAKWEQVTLNIRKSGFMPHGLFAATAFVGAAIDSLLGAAGLTETKVWVRKVSNPRNFVGDFCDTLIKIKQTVARCTLTFKGRTLSNLVLLSFDLDFSTEDDAGRFSLEFKKVKTAVTKSASLPKPAALLAKPPTFKIPGKKDASEEEVAAREHSKTTMLKGALKGVLP